MENVVLGVHNWSEESMQYDSHNKFATTTVILHWLVGITIIGLLATGIYMTENNVYELFSWHKAFGFLVLIVAIARVIWRMKNGWPIVCPRGFKIRNLVLDVTRERFVLSPIKRWKQEAGLETFASGCSLSSSDRFVRDKQ